MKLPKLNIGIVGHNNHGKTTLTAALTKVMSEIHGGKVTSYEELDSTPLEKERGATISLSHVEFSTANRIYTVVDCPGHAQYIKTSILGMSQVDAAILVCSATEGAMAQTREHLILLGQHNIKKLVIFLNKVDIIVDVEVLELIEMELRDLVSQYGFDGDDTPIIYGSAKLALDQDTSSIGTQSIVKLTEVLDSYLPIVLEPVENEPFLLPIEHVFNIHTKGIIVSGRIESGSIKVGEIVEVVGGGKTIKVTCLEIESFRNSTSYAEKGDSVGILLGIPRGVKLVKGQVLSTPNTVKTSSKFSATIQMLGKYEGGRSSPIFNNYAPQFFFRTISITGKIEVDSEVPMIQEGNTGKIIVELTSPIVISKHLQFVMRDHGQTVGIGVITELLN